MIWTLAIANILAVIVLLACAPWFSKLASVRSDLLVPFVILLSMLGSYLGAGAWQNFAVLLILGFIAYLFKKHDWPRAPFVVGIVLGPIAEGSLHKAMAIWGYSFLLRPLSLVMLALIVGTVVLNVTRLLRRGESHAHS
jgi:TctA family transporter